MKQVLPQATTKMNLTDTMLSKRNQTQRNISMILVITVSKISKTKSVVTEIKTMII